MAGENIQCSDGGWSPEIVKCPEIFTDWLTHKKNPEKGVEAGRNKRCCDPWWTVFWENSVPCWGETNSVIRVRERMSRWDRPGRPECWTNGVWRPAFTWVRGGFTNKRTNTREKNGEWLAKTVFLSVLLVHQGVEWKHQGAPTWMGQGCRLDEALRMILAINKEPLNSELQGLVVWAFKELERIQRAT